MQKALVAVLFAMLVGCTSTPPKTFSEHLSSHPEWPSPVRPQTIDFKQVTVDDKTYIALDFSQSVDLAIYLEDILRYINKTNNMLCYYRDELNEDRCSDLTND